MMKPEEKILMLMRQQGKMQQGKGLQLAEMKSASECLVGDLLLDREDYLKAEHLDLKAGDDVLVYKLDKSTYVILEKVV